MMMMMIMMTTVIIIIIIIITTIIIIKLLGLHSKHIITTNCNRDRINYIIKMTTF
jgi:hypothetical protein